MFWGTLPPESVDGISLSNIINISLLKSRYDVVIIREKSDLQDHNLLTFRKVIAFLVNVWHLTVTAVKNNYSYFYLTFSMSTMGAIKTLIVISVFHALNKTPIVVHMHRGDFFKFHNKRINRCLTSIMLRYISSVIVLSSAQALDFSKILTNKIEVLENTVTKEYEYGEKTFNNYNFIYVSNYIAEKGIMELLEAFSAATKLNGLISLECHGNYSDTRIINTINAYRSPAISIYNSIHDEIKFKKIFDSCCLILPSWNEGQPLVLLEAMSLGTPVIATDVGLVRELLGEAYPYLCKPKDVFSLSNAILRFIDEPDKKSISDYLRSRYFMFFSNKIHKAKIESIFI